MYQAAICVAAGVPFLGHETVKGRVLIADFENGIADMHELVERISRYIVLPGPPDDLYFWSPNDCDPGYGQPGHTLIEMVRNLAPAWGIVDSLGSYAPVAEGKNSWATQTLRDSRALAREIP